MAGGCRGKIRALELLQVDAVVDAVHFGSGVRVFFLQKTHAKIAHGHDRARGADYFA